MMRLLLYVSLGLAVRSLDCWGLQEARARGGLLFVRLVPELVWLVDYSEPAGRFSRKRTSSVH